MVATPFWEKAICPAVSLVELMVYLGVGCRLATSQRPSECHLAGAIKVILCNY